jgi:hypothetical protein
MGKSACFSLHVHFVCVDLQRLAPQRRDLIQKHSPIRPPAGRKMLPLRIRIASSSSTQLVTQPKAETIAPSHPAH